MSPIKFEENIKDKLEKRSLSPSADSWSKLAERLDAEEKSSKRPLFWWLSVAAGLLIMMAIAVQFFSMDESDQVSPQVVEDTKTEIQEKIQVQDALPEKSIQLVEQKVKTNEEQESSSIQKESQIKDYKKEIQGEFKAETKLVNQKASDSNIIQLSKEELLEKETQDLLDEAIMNNAIANAFKELKSENIVVSDEEIDSLLKIASKELFKERLQSETTRTVDADALLRSVEDEMGQSFRNRVFEALKESYETIRTAVADRNN